MPEAGTLNAAVCCPNELINVTVQSPPTRATDPTPLLFAVISTRSRGTVHAPIAATGAPTGTKTARAFDKIAPPGLRAVKLTRQVVDITPSDISA